MTVSIAGAAKDFDKKIFGETYKAHCSEAKTEKILNSSDDSIKINCSLKLKNSDVIHKKIFLSGSDSSDIYFDCQGAKIRPATDGAVEIKSILLSNNTYDRPKNIVFHRCHFEGSVRTMGMGRNGQAIELRDSSRS